MGQMTLRCSQLLHNYTRTCAVLSEIIQRSCLNVKSSNKTLVKVEVVHLSPEASALKCTEVSKVHVKVHCAYFLYTILYTMDELINSCAILRLLYFTSIF